MINSLKALILCISLCLTTLVADVKNDSSSDNTQRKSENEVDLARNHLITFLKELSKTAKKASTDDSNIVEFAKLIIQDLAIEKMSGFVLATHANDLSKELMISFERTLTLYFSTYAKKQNIALFASVDMEKENFTFREEVNTEKGRYSFEKEFKTSEKPVKVKMVFLKIKNGFKLFDVVIEDLSLLITTRDHIKTMWSEQQDVKTFLDHFKKSSEDYLKEVLKDFNTPSLIDGFHQLIKGVLK